jgi:Fur family ferric uptake transcriptional regulator|tara:strand:+ start:51 stop:467 length:417 start_codon:yes stop_codon:yes gene_type:complete
MNNQNKELKKAGLKATLPRIKIMEVLESTAIQEEAHFSAEDIYKELLSNGENIGLASVYRVLTQFEAAGMVKKHHFEGSHAVYEVVEENHEHMVDVESGKVLEFQDVELINKLNKIANDAGYQLVDHNLVLHVKKIES